MGTADFPGQRSWLQRFTRRYGWRAYALPILAVVTVVVLIRQTASPAQTPDHADAAARHVAATRPTTRAPATPATRATGAPTGLTGAQFETLPADYTPCTSNQQQQLVLVSISKQRAWMCQGAQQVYSTLVTTGAANVGDGTPLGTWHVQDKQTDRYLVGPGYRDYVHFWEPFDGDFGFHDAPWQTMPYGSAGYRANGSHGCVHLPEKAMSWFFNWSQSGVTTVTIVD